MSPSPVEVRSPVRAGEVIDGKYKVDGILGAGGMGVVVSATHLALDEPVALKFMTAEGKSDETARARFLREAKAARKLTSAHVARVFDVGQLRSGEPYIVMELLRGDDLAKHLRVHGRLSAGDTVRYVLQVCDAIREAHALGIVHRDLKPQNLFLSKRPGSGPVIKVLDFGIAKSLDLADTNGSLTGSQNVVGSPIYMSPEQLRASKHVDTRTDIWSIGVIMFELLTGKVPFAGDSVLELGMRIMTVPAPSLATIRAEVPSGLASIVEKCLEKDPEKRFATIDALALELRPFADVSQRQLPFADTMDEKRPEALSQVDPEHSRTGGEFAGTNGASSRPGRSTSLRLLLVAAIPVVLGAAFLARHQAGEASPTVRVAASRAAVPVAPSVTASTPWVVASGPVPDVPSPPPVADAPAVATAEPHHLGRGPLRRVLEVPSPAPSASASVNRAPAPMASAPAPVAPAPSAPRTTTNDSPIVR